MTRFAAATILACGALAALEVGQLAGVAAPRGLVVAAASVAAVLAATAAVRHVAFIWRGPVILPFHRREGMLCDAREADAVRAAAQLRGTMGGAGHLYPSRLALSAAAWAAASAQALALLPPERSVVTFAPLAVVLLAGGLARVFPPTAFFYRETAGGCVVAFPSHVCLQLLETAGLDPAPRPIELAVAGRAGEAGAPGEVEGAGRPRRLDETWP